jgi:carbonic anhydrase
MRLLEAIIDANHRAAAGDSKAGLHPAEFESGLPLVALTCIDPRLNSLFPQALGIPAEDFIWLRNAGNVITGPMSSTMRSLALACAIKQGKEIAIIGHTDCLVGKTTASQVIDRMKALGVPRNRLPDNLADFFGIFASERQNVLKAVDFVRQSPLIGANTPVHGLIIQTDTGRLEWLSNGYQTLNAPAPDWQSVKQSAGEAIDNLKSLAEFKIGEMKFPENKIGEAAIHTAEWAASKIQKQVSSIEQAASGTAASAATPPLPPAIGAAPNVKGFNAPPRISAALREKLNLRKTGR